MTEDGIIVWLDKWFVQSGFSSFKDGVMFVMGCFFALVMLISITAKLLWDGWRQK